MDSLELAIKLCPLLSIALAAAGGVFALWQWSTGNSYKRALLLKDLISMLRDDEETASVFDTSIGAGTSTTTGASTYQGLGARR